jgi:nicotinamidase-related amidase
MGATMSGETGSYIRSSELLSRGASRLVIVDVQEKLVPLIAAGEMMVSNCRRLIEGARALGVPVFATEQYPKGLGRTVPALRELFDAIPEKLRFSSVEVLNWGFAGDGTSDRDQVVVAGIEAHVCVLQTALDLIAHGYRVFVPADAVASRGELDWKIALDRLASAGAVIATTESVLFEWCETAGTPEFKQISRLIKQG